MGKVVYEDPIHHISGKISRKYRTCYNYRKWSDRKYTSVHGDRTTPASTEELKVRAKFKVVRQAALNRSMDLSHLTKARRSSTRPTKVGCSAKVGSTSTRVPTR